MLEMPSFLAEGSVPPTLNGSGPASKRSSLDRRNHSPNGHRHEDGKSNGVMTNGNSPGLHSMQTLPNGHRASVESAGRRSMAENGTPGEPNSKRSSRVGQEKERSEDRPVAERLATRDDGYFAVQTAETDEGWFSTRVKLVAVKGESAQESEESQIEEASGVLPGTTVYTSEPGTTSPVEGSLRVPSQTNRVASHPALSSSYPPAQLGMQQQAPRLQQRHTLEVPRVSTSRLSRETTNSINPIDDSIVSATGRFSPATPTRRRGSLTLVRRVTRSIHSDMHLDEVPQDHDAAQYAEVYRQKRISRRKRKEEEEEDRVLVGTKVDQNHVNYVMAYNMLTGIRFTVSRTNAKMDRELTEADFSARHKFSFDV
jgi:1-phosphatidylinositol-4-phosphate 5-kinase